MTQFFLIFALCFSGSLFASELSPLQRLVLTAKKIDDQITEIKNRENKDHIKFNDERLSYRESIRMHLYFLTDMSTILGHPTNIVLRQNLISKDSKTFVSDLKLLTKEISKNIGGVRLVGFELQPGYRVISDIHYEETIRADRARSEERNSQNIVGLLMSSLGTLDRKISEVESKEKVHIDLPSLNRYSFDLHYYSEEEILDEKIRTLETLNITANSHLEFFENLLKINDKNPDLVLVGFQTSPKYYKITTITPNEVKSWGRLKPGSISEKIFKISEGPLTSCELAVGH